MFPTSPSCSWAIPVKSASPSTMNWVTITLQRFLRVRVRVRRIGPQQVGVKHLARDGRRRGGAETTVLHQNGDGYLRVIGGRVGDEPGMIAPAFIGDFRAGTFVLLDGEHLRGARLARHFILGADDPK